MNGNDSRFANLSEPEGITVTRRHEDAPVSADQLRHPLTGKALRWIQKAEGLIRAGEHLKAIEELRRALKNSEAAPYAHSLLGQEYMKTSQISAAVPELQQAVRLLPSNVTNHANLGYALLLTGQLDPAEPELLRALELEPKNPRTHLVMGVLRFCQGSHDPEAQMHLELAARDVPAARLMLAKFYHLTGNPEAEEREFQSYLKAMGMTDSARLRQWLQEGELVSAAR